MISIMSTDILMSLLPFARGRKTVPEGAFLFGIGEPVEAIHVVEQGLVQLVRWQADGALAVLQRAGPGDIVAEASLFAPSYHCDGVAVRESDVWSVTANDVRNLLREDMIFANAWIAHLSRQLHLSRRRTEILTLRTVRMRLDAWLTWNDGVLPTKGAWKHLAEELGVSPEAFYREIARRATDC
jgi:CRP-like cAMP-binding protein